jgi:hypothetical protein
MLINEKLRIQIQLPDSILTKDSIKDIFLGLSEHVFSETEKDIKIQYIYQKNNGESNKTVHTNNSPNSRFEIDKLQALPDSRIYHVNISMNRPIDTIEILSELTNEIKKIKSKIEHIGMTMTFSIGSPGGYGQEKTNAVFNFYIKEDISKIIGTEYDDVIAKNDKINVMINNFNRRTNIQGFFVQGDYKKFYLLSNDTTIVLEKIESYLNLFKIELEKEIGDYEEYHKWDITIDNNAKRPILQINKNQYTTTSHIYTLIP